jgi:indolepyruvate ferredoxin oxidoreductase
VDYQDRRLAARFLDLVAEVAAVDGPDHELTRSVAEGWFKVLTYKDEYEVARLHRRVDYAAAARELGITGDVAVRYHLHPPALRRLGLRRKLPMGKALRRGLRRALARMKRLRGTKLDVFGYDRDRRLERAVIEEYEALVRDVVLDARPIQSAGCGRRGPCSRSRATARSRTRPWPAGGPRSPS